MAETPAAEQPEDPADERAPDEPMVDLPDEVLLDAAEAPLSEDERRDLDDLQRKDRAFLFRIGLRVGVAILLGIWLAITISEMDVGGCAARSFRTVTSP